MVSVKGIAILVFGMVVGGVVVSNSSAMQSSPAAKANAEEVITGHRVNPLGQEMLTFKGARAQIVAL